MRTLAVMLLAALVAHSAPAQQGAAAPDVEAPLIEAAKAGDLERVRALLEDGTDVEVQTEAPGFTIGWTPLMHAVRHDHPRVVGALLEAGASLESEYVSVPIYNSKETIHAELIAARHAGRDVMARIIDAGGDFTLEHLDSDGLLHLAALNDEPGLIRYLIDDLGMDPNAQNELGRTPIFFAARWLPRTLPDPLLEDPIVRDPEAEIAHLEVMLELDQSGAQVNRFDRSGSTPLLVACGEGTRAQVEFLLNRGARTFDSPDDPFAGPRDERDAERLRTIRPVAIVAADSGDAGVLTLLAEFGADMTATDPRGRDLLQLASIKANSLVIPELIEIGFDPDLPDADALTPLMLACIAPTDPSRRRDQHRGHVPSVRALLGGGADVSLTDAQGRTALHYAAGSGVPQLVEALLEAGADPGAKDDEGRTPLDYTEPDAPRLTRWPILPDHRARGAEPLNDALDKADTDDEPQGDG